MTEFQAVQNIMQVNMKMNINTNCSAKYSTYKSTTTCGDGYRLSNREGCVILAKPNVLELAFAIESRKVSKHHLLRKINKNTTDGEQ